MVGVRGMVEVVHDMEVVDRAMEVVVRDMAVEADMEVEADMVEVDMVEVDMASR